MSKNDKFIVIGLIGAAGAGRNTVADILSSIEPGFCICSFSDFIRAEVINAFGVSSDLFTNRNLNSRIDPALGIIRCSDVEFIERMTAIGHNLIAPRAPREIMQLWGVEYRRNQDPDYWIEQLYAFIHEKIKSGIRQFIVPDLWFLSDIELIIKMHGEIWLIRRKKVEKDTSQCPGGWDSMEHLSGFIDRTITNDRNVFSLMAQVIDTYSGETNEETF